MVCPDIMNLVTERKEKNLITEFKPFARKYSTNVIKHWSGRTLNYNTSTLRLGCAFIKGAVLSPNCLTVNITKFYYYPFHNSFICNKINIRIMVVY